MATHSSIAWEIPRTEEPGGLHSMGLRRVGHYLAIEPPPPPHNIRVIVGMETLFSAWKHRPTCRLCPRDLFLSITFPHGCHATRNMHEGVFLMYDALGLIIFILGENKTHTHTHTHTHTSLCSCVYQTFN